MSNTSYLIGGVSYDARVSNGINGTIITLSHEALSETTSVSDIDIHIPETITLGSNDGVIYYRCKSGGKMMKWKWLPIGLVKSRSIDPVALAVGMVADVIH